MAKIEPIRAEFTLEVLSAEQLAELRSATLHVLEHTGIHFPSERALRVLDQAGAQVDWARQVARLSPALVIEAMSRVSPPMRDASTYDDGAVGTAQMSTMLASSAPSAPRA